MKEYQSELTKANRRAAEDRIREDVIVKCKVCDGIMKFHREKTENAIEFINNYYHCSICLRNVVLTQL